VSESVSWNVSALLGEVVEKGWDVAQKCMSPPSSGLRNLFDTILSYFQWLDEINKSLPLKQFLSTGVEFVVETPPQRSIRALFIDEDRENDRHKLQRRTVVSSVATTATPSTNKD